MLDQNTDRMWFVIGAVIVGAAIIFIANGTLPEIFASVTETFETKTEDVTGVVAALTPGGQLEGERVLSSDTIDFWHASGDVSTYDVDRTLDVSFTGESDTPRIRFIGLSVKPGDRLLMSFDYDRGGNPTIEGVPFSLGVFDSGSGTISLDDARVWVDGQEADVTWHGNKASMATFSAPGSGRIKMDVTIRNYTGESWIGVYPISRHEFGPFEGEGLIRLSNLDVRQVWAEQ